ncbi:MAG: ATP synthase F1 subunit delta [Nitrospinae bacterium]|nr:ATP synthase F1 subunit delta [Nitrospinota bacterium]
MIDRVILGRYAKAFMETVLEQKLLDKVEGQLANVDKVCKDNPSFVQTLNNPLLAKDKKKALIEKIFSGSLDPALRNFMSLLVDKRREHILPYLHEEFSRLADGHKNIVKAEVETVFFLSPQQVEGLKKKLSAISGKQVVINQSINPDIIGGLVITMGSKIIDASVVGRLKKAKECMLK